MDKIWAPWRGEYIQKGNKEDCFLCRILAENQDAANYVLYRGEQAFALLNLYPYNAGHIMLAPLRHIPALSDFTTEELDEIFYLLKAAEVGLKNYLKCEGINVGINLNKCAGAGLEEHIHIHLVPRWNGDTNFMPVIFETKVLSIHLDQIYNTLLPAFQRI